MRTAYLILLLTVVAGVSILGFRGSKFTHPPMDVFPEAIFPAMRNQPKYDPQGASEFFADGRADRPLPPGVVPANYGPLGKPLYHDLHYTEGKTADGQFARGFPSQVTVNQQFIEHGRERFEIYCAPCHGALGDGNGITKKYGMGATPSYQDQRIIDMPEGEIFNTITHGKGNMLSYADKLSIHDRWAVICYVRALQRAEHGTVDDVAPAHRSELGLK